MTKPNIKTLWAHITNRWSRNGQKVEYIVLHYVGAVSSAEANARYLNRDGNLGWSAHFFTDQYSIWQSVPLDESAGHCGVDYSYGKAPFWGKCRNKNSIGIEMCCKKDSAGRWYIEPETVTNTVVLVRWLMEEYNISIDHVVRHYDVCWKTCPEPWVRDESQWKAFKQRISGEEIEMNEKELIELIDKRITAKLVGENTKPSQWIVDTKELEEAVAAGITDGTRPGGYAKREEVAAMVLREHKSVMSKAADEAAEAVKAVLEKIKGVL
jgi:N-acetylmuramoyl-L-alanine amidase CwlA